MELLNPPLIKNKGLFLCSEQEGVHVGTLGSHTAAVLQQKIF